jgi:hypothetical protein
VGWAASGRYYEEAREGQIMSAGSRSQRGAPKGNGPGYPSTRSPGIETWEDVWGKRSA